MQSFIDFAPFITLRRVLHQMPELSGQEIQTAQKIRSFLEDHYPPDMILGQLGGNGLACIYQGIKAGPSLLFRCELDALPISEVNDFSYASRYPNVSHKCGHDGHMAILCSIAALLHKQRPSKGQVILLFQPAEEIGLGAQAVFDDPQFENIQPDYVFALHNLPGYPLKQVILKSGIFTCASKAMHVKLMGKTAHAAYPAQGKSPAIALAHLMLALEDLPQTSTWKNIYTLVTLIHARLGSKAAGVAPGEAELVATIRSEENADLEKLASYATLMVQAIAKEHQLQVEIHWTDEFLANNNDEEACQLIRKIAEKERFSIFDLKEAIRFSEDFGVFTSNFQGAMLGLGAGENMPSLHNPDYDFPDDLIPVGHHLFKGIIEEVLEG